MDTRWGNWSRRNVLEVGVNHWLPPVNETPAAMDVIKNSHHFALINDTVLWLKNNIYHISNMKMLDVLLDD